MVLMILMLSICSERLVALHRPGSRAPPPVRYRAKVCYAFCSNVFSVSGGLQALKLQPVSPARGIICHIFI